MATFGSNSETVRVRLLGCEFPSFHLIRASDRMLNTAHTTTTTQQANKNVNIKKMQVSRQLG
jgi:hypothetical protein